MSQTVRICIVAGQVGGLETEAVARLEALGLEPLLLPEDSPPAARQAQLAKCAMLAALYPTDAAAHLVLGLAAGMDLPVFVLAAKADPTPYPRGTKVLTSLQALVDAVPAAGKGRHVDEPLLKRIGACREGVAWYLRRYPGGRHSSEWTLKEQLESFADGGGPWLKTAFDYRLIPHHAMDGADLRKADLTNLRLHDGSLKGAKLAGATLTGAQLGTTPLAGADLTGADLVRASFDGCDLSGAVLEGARLEAAFLDRSPLDDAKAAKADLSRARLARSSAQRADFSGAILAGGSFDNVDFAAADLSGADLRGAQFVGCRFAGTNLKAAQLGGSTFIGCEMASADFTGADLDAAYVQERRF
ncbi:MAG: Pentapeptide repeat family protein [Caulobacter sp.]|jgi:uncharacterized protein YjbI with pentapeptide repeats|nr:Pentapeptide repeat family protein [Caulobacter sp.]